MQYTILSQAIHPSVEGWEKFQVLVTGIPELEEKFSNGYPVETAVIRYKQVEQIRYDGEGNQITEIIQENKTQEEMIAELEASLQQTIESVLASLNNN